MIIVLKHLPWRLSALEREIQETGEVHGAKQVVSQSSSWEG